MPNIFRRSLNDLLSPHLRNHFYLSSADNFFAARLAFENSFPADAFTQEQIVEPELTGMLPAREALLPLLLSETPLYSNIEAHEIHPAVRHYLPEYQLWSDGEEKERWIYIPECAQIDSSDPDNWSFPVGTRFFKEFSVDYFSRNFP